MVGPRLDSCDWCVVKLVVAPIPSHHHGTRWGRFRTWWRQFPKQLQNSEAKFVKWLTVILDSQTSSGLVNWDVKRMKWRKLMLSIVQRDQTCKNLQVQTQGCSDLCSLRGELSLATQKCDDQPKGGACDEFWSGCLDEQYAEFASCLYPMISHVPGFATTFGGIPRNVPIEWDDTFRPARLSCCYGLLLWSECHPDSRMAVGFQHCAAATAAGLPGIEDPWAADWTCEQCGLVSWLSTLNAFFLWFEGLKNLVNHLNWRQKWIGIDWQDGSIQIMWPYKQPAFVDVFWSHF